MFLKDLLFPKLCLGCNALGSYICTHCQKKLEPINKDNCFYCQKASYMGLTHPGCKKTYGIDGITEFYSYNSFLQKIIKHIKYRGATDIWKEFYQIIQPELYKKLLFYKRFIKNGLIQPVPLYSTKFKNRGFNQSLLISSLFNTILRLPVVYYFERVKETLPQAELHNERDRYLNIKGAFKLIRKRVIKNKTFIIIDDVITSGSTVLEFTKAIKKCGTQKVFALALARG